MENRFVHGDESTIKHPHFYHSGSCGLLYSLHGLLQVLCHPIILCYQELDHRTRGFCIRGLEASTMVVGCLLTSDTITLSSMCSGNVWSFGSYFLHACTILWCDLSNDKFYISISRSSLRRETSPFLLGTYCDSGGGEGCGATSDALGMRLVSWSYGSYSISMSFLNHALNMLRKFLNLHLPTLFFICWIHG